MPHVAQRPVSFTRLMSNISLNDFGFCQSIPVEGRRWTLSLSSDQITIGNPQATQAVSAE